MAGAIGFVADRFTADQVADVRQAVIDLSSRALTENAVNQIIVKTIDDVLRPGRFDIVSLGFVLALWSGSRASTSSSTPSRSCTGSAGTGGSSRPERCPSCSTCWRWSPASSRSRWSSRPEPGRRLAARTARLPHGLLLADRLRGLHLLPRDALPRVGAGADQLELQPAGGDVLPRLLDPRILLLRWFLTATAADSGSVYGPLAAPIAVLLWLYLLSIAVLIGAAVNAAFDEVFPQKATTRARLELMQRLRRLGSREQTE